MGHSGRELDLGASVFECGTRSAGSIELSSILDKRLDPEHDFLDVIGMLSH